MNLYLWLAGGVALGAWLEDLAHRRRFRRLSAALSVRTVNTAPPTTAEITAGIDQHCPRCGNYPDTPGHFYGCAERNPLVGLWAKRNTSSGHFDAIKRSGDVTKGVRREN